MLAAASNWVEVSTKAAMHVIDLFLAVRTGRGSGGCRYMQWPLRYQLLGRNGSQGVPSRLLGQISPSVIWLRWHLSVQALRYVCRGGSVVVFFGSKAACPLQIGQRIWPQSLRHPAFPLWMPAILFLAPKAGEARRKERRKEVKREGRNWRKEPRKPASQEGRKKDALSVNIVYIKFHQVPNRPPFGTVVQFLQPTFRCPEWGMWKGLKMDTITRIDVASDTTMFSRVREVVRAAFLLDAVFLGFMCLFVLFCFVLFC